MIYHEMFGQHIRLGNFLFKWAWSIKMRERYGLNTTYPDYYLWKYLKNPPQIGDIPKLEEVDILRPHKWEYSSYLDSIVDEFVLEGKDTLVALNFFFQSEQWFKEEKEQVFNSLQFKAEEKSRIYTKYFDFFRKKTIGIGVRLGDFVGHGDFYQIEPEWYLRALVSEFENFYDYNIVVFSDDILKAKEIFKEYPFFYPEENHTFTHADNFKYYHGDASEQFILGTMMDNFILGNSTFSWWQSWLVENHPMFNGKIIHSGKVFSDTGNMKDINTSLYYPERWIKFD